MEVRVKQCKSAFSPSRLPGLDWAINPYRGCAHSCAYCYAQDVTRFEMSRPWGSIVEVKAGLVQCLKKELDRRPKRGTYGIGTVTDPYQPLEKEYELTRGCLQLLKRFGMNASILTKSNLVLRDMDVLSSWEDVEVGMSIGCADEKVARLLEPGAVGPAQRFDALKKLADQGVHTYLMAAPIIPGISDSEQHIERLLDCAREASVPTIIWDKYNPKPIAGKRLREALHLSQLPTPPAQAEARVSDIGRMFSEGCASRGISLSDAF